MNTKQHTGQRQAIIWGRFSSDQQKDGDSKDRQNRLNRASAKRERIKVLAEYFDEGVSVKDGATPLFRKVIAELPAGVGIICENLDRINRGHPWRAKAYIADILDAGHFILTSQDGREYTSESIEQLDTMVIGDMATNVARYENNKRIQRVREEVSKVIDLARKGVPAPLGAWLPAHVKYNFDTQSYIINDAIKATYRRIFEEYLSGKGTRTVCKGLNKDNTPTFGSKKAGCWTGSAICKLLRNERAIGTLTINGERIPKAFPPAIKEELFYQVQSMLAKNVNRRGKRNAEKVQNVFRGLCRCSVCGGAVKVYGNKYIGCSGYRTSRQDKNGNPCTIKNLIPFAEMEQEFLSWFVPQAKHALLGKDKTYPRIDALDARKKALATRIDITLGLLDDNDNPLPVEQIKSRLTKLEAETREVESNLAEARAEASSKAVLPDTIKELETLIDGANLGNQDIRRKIANVVPSIVKDVVIDLQYRDTPSFKVSLIDGQALEWLYNFPEYVKPIIGITKQGDFVLGKGKAIDGHFKQTK